MAPRSLTILQLTHQGQGAGSTQSVFSLSRELARHGHRVLVGCPADTLLARMVTAAPSLTHVALNFTRLRPDANAIAAAIAQYGVHVVNSHATGDRRALAWLRWRRRLPQAFVVTRRTMPLTSPPELVAVAFVGIHADDELRAAQAAVPPRHSVVFVPFTDRPLAFYRFATVAALPSRIEGLSQALLEAMSLGIPVIASAAGDNPELVYPGETGLLVPPLDPGAWARALDRLLGDHALRQRLGRAGQALARSQFTMARTAARTEAVYGEALERRRLLSGERFR